MELSVLIPARNEEFLGKTINDVLEHIEAETEIIAIMDGYKADLSEVKPDPRITVIYHPESIGQRAATNEAARVAKGKYLMKVDAHCAFDQGFDRKMLDAFKEVGDDVTMVPVMKNLHAFDWVCEDAEPRKTFNGDDEPHRRYQSPSGPCKDCGKPTTKDLVWYPKRSPNSTSYCFDPEPHFQYFGDYAKRPEAQKDISETMSLQGSCFMCTKEMYMRLDLCSEDLYSWGSQGIEVAVKTWLSGGRVLCNKRTSYAHMFRTRGGDFGFPYPQRGSKVQENKKKVKELFFNDNWPKQIRPLSWLVERFWPVNGWTDEDLKNLKLVGGKFVYPSVPLSSPNSVANLTSSLSPINVGSKEVSVLTVDHSGLSGTGADTTQNINLMTDESKMEGVTTQSIITDVVNNGNILTKVHRERPDQPSVHDSMNPNLGAIETNPSISKIISITDPVPAPSNNVNSDFSEKSNKELSGNMVNNEQVVLSHSPHFTTDLESKSMDKMTKGIIYYCDGELKEEIAKPCRERLAKIAKEKGIPIVTAALRKRQDFGVKNIYFPHLKKCALTLFKQIYAALEHSTADIIYFAEADDLYDPSHYDFTPPEENKDKPIYYYNTNIWQLRYEDGHCIYYHCRKMSQLVCFRETALEHFKKKIAKVEQDPIPGHFDRSIGFEPGTRRINSGGVDDTTHFDFQSPVPNVDIRHDSNFTGSKWKLEDFRNSKYRNDAAATWQEGDSIPSWGKGLDLVNLLQ